MLLNRTYPSHFVPIAMVVTDSIQWRKYDFTSHSCCISYYITPFCVPGDMVWNGKKSERAIRLKGYYAHSK